MAGKKSAFQLELEQRDLIVQRYRTELPSNDNDAELVKQYGLAIAAYNAAALKNDEQGMRDAVARAEACVANHWGCSPGEKYDGPRDRFDCWFSACKDLAENTAAADGEIPMYGQRGRFMLMLAGCRVDFHYDGLFGICGGDANVVDLEKPFISGTGYRSFQVCPIDKLVWTGGLPLDEYMRRVCTKQLLNGASGKLKEPKLVMVENDTIGKNKSVAKHQWLRDQRASDPAWMPGGFLAKIVGQAAAFAIREERNGQLALML